MYSNALYDNTYLYYKKNMKKFIIKINQILIRAKHKNVQKNVLDSALLYHTKYTQTEKTTTIRRTAVRETSICRHNGGPFQGPH